MFFKNNIHTIALNICAVSLVALLSLSCTATMKDGMQRSDNQLLAENSMMKKRLPMVERESDVLKKESRQYRMKVQELEAQNKKLSLELTSLNEKYTNDVAIGEEKISYLHEFVQKIEKENSERIEEFIALNEVLETNFARESQALKEQISTQKASFVKEREQILEENAKRDLNQSIEINTLKKELEPKESQILAFKLAINEISVQLGAATTLSEALRKARDESLAELESVKAANIKARDESLAELVSVKAASTKITEESLAELNSVKATNANLNKKMTELSSQLSNQHIPTKTTN
jgi:chromosome segregation ATPase